MAWGLKRANVRFAFLGDHANSRGAADMGLFPDLLPGYVPVTAPGAFARISGPARRARQDAAGDVAAAASGELGALLVVGANPIPRLAANPPA